MPSILLIGAETEFRKSLKGYLKNRFHFFSSGSLKEGVRNIQKNQIDLVVVQIDPKFLKSASWLTKITRTGSAESGELSVLLLADYKYANNKSFLELSEHSLVQDIYWMQGYHDETSSLFLKTVGIFLEKNLQMLHYKRAASRNALKVNLLQQENRIPAARTTEEPHPSQQHKNESAPPSFLSGSSPAVEIFRGNLESLARRPGPVFLVGPNGLEQDKIAAFIHHFLARRAKHHFAEIDLGAVPGHLQDSILFGLQEKNLPGFSDLGKGLFEKCRNGTLFMRHIEKLNWDAQSKLLQVFRDGYFMRLDEKIHVKCKTVITTETDLEKLVDRGAFRQNLHSHLSPAALEIPNLAGRRPDLPQVIDRYAEWFCEIFSKHLEVTSPFKSELSRKRYSGQIDEFTAILHTALTLANSEVGPELIAKAEELYQQETPARENPGRTRSKVKVSGNEIPHGIGASESDLTNFLRENVSQKTLPLFQNMTPEKSHYSLEELEREYINLTLRQNHHNISETARVLGISRKTLYKKIKEYHIEKTNAS